MESTATINLRSKISSHVGKRRKRSIDYLRAKISEMAKVGIESVRISSDLNRLINVHSGKHLKRVKVKFVVDKGIAVVSPFEENIKVKASEALTLASEKPPSARG